MPRETRWEGEREIEYGETTSPFVEGEEYECEECGRDLITPEELERQVCDDCWGKMEKREIMKEKLLFKKREDRLQKGGKIMAYDKFSQMEPGRFSSDGDVWFDELATFSETGKKDPTLEEMYAISIGEDFSREAFKEFHSLAMSLVYYSFRKPLIEFMDNMMGGVYDKEFGAFEDSEYSMIGELFSHFRQAYKYY